MEKARILVVEDDDLMQGMLQDSLSKEGYEIIVASDGMNGWQEFKKSSFDVILLDLKLPKMDGMTLLSKIHETNSESLVLIMTAHGTVETAVKAMKLGAFDYVTKPFMVDELLVIIKRGLELRALKKENVLLKKELNQRYSLHNIVGKCKLMQDIYDLLEIVAPTTATILIQGESGTGKELIADAIHYLSPRKDMPIIKVSCAALPETLLESELFGHEKGAFTDAKSRKLGRFELANMGTIFLDDVDDMKPAVQVKLLRVLQEKKFERVGGTESIDADVRVVAASKTDLYQAARDGNFREDLYYRLNVVPIFLPSLRERKEDIPLLAQHFLRKYNKQLNKNIELLPEALQMMVYYDWEGNIRELENLIERLVTVSHKNKILPKDLPENITIKKAWRPIGLKSVVRDVEKEHIIKVLETTNGKKKEAANILGITTKTLWQKMKEYKI